MLCKKVGCPQQEEVFLAALLQDIGMLVLDRVLQDEYGAIHDKVRSHATLAAAEQVRADRHIQIALGVLRPNADVMADGERVSLIEALGQAGKSDCVSVLLRVLAEAKSDKVREAALAALQPFAGAMVTKAVLDAYPRLSAGLRGRAQTLLCSRPASALALLRAVDAGSIAAKFRRTTSATLGESSRSSAATTLPRKSGEDARGSTNTDSTGSRIASSPLASTVFRARMRSSGSASRFMKKRRAPQCKHCKRASCPSCQDVHDVHRVHWAHRAAPGG